MAAVTVPSDFGARENKICYEVMGPDTIILVFWMLSFKPAFSLSSFTLIKRLFSFSLLSAILVSRYLLLLNKSSYYFFSKSSYYFLVT